MTQISEAPANQWRHLFGPEGSNAPFFVRNDVHFYDIRLDKGAQSKCPKCRQIGIPISPSSLARSRLAGKASAKQNRTYELRADVHRQMRNLSSSHSY